MLALLVFAIGCDREEEQSTPAQDKAKVQSRMEDPAYRKRLKGFVADQNKVAKELNEIERQMEIQRDRARDALPADATDEQILAELESKPTKYPEWKYLVGRRNVANKAMKQRRAEARAAVLARIAKEQKEQQAASSAAK